MSATALDKRDKFDGQAQPDGLGPALDRAKALLDSCFEPQSPLLARLSRLSERLAHQRLQVAVLGQFKRGKSTFLNALLGAPLLPSAVVPVTAVPTFIAWGAKPSIRISFDDQRPPEEHTAEDTKLIQGFLFRFVAEEANPQNHLGVVKAELFYPAPILSDGSVLIDTPGVGSTLKHNTDAAWRALPECDAALFVVATDPPITEVELDYLEQVKSKASRIFLIVNKMDTLAAEERDALINFLRKVLQERSLMPEDSAIFQVSARDGLAAKQIGDRLGLERSGINGIEDRLLRFLATEKTGSLEQAIARKAADLLTQAADQIELRIQAIKMPLDELEAKTSAFETALRGIEEQRRVTGDLLVGDKRRLVEALEARINELRVDSRRQLAGVIGRSLAGTDPETWERAAQNALSMEIEKIFETAQEQITRDCSTNADAVLSAYQRRIDELIGSIRRTAAELFDISFRDDIDRDSFALGEDPYWVTEDIAATLIPDPSRLVDRLLPMGQKRRRLWGRLVRSTEQLIVRNAENLRWALFRGFDETFRNATGHIEERLDDALEATRSVIEKVLADRRGRSFAAEPELARLTEALSSLTTIRESLRTEFVP
jgi:GTP-binding protein EngB required for normal cell division